MQRYQSWPKGRPFSNDEDFMTDQDRIIAFRKRQQEDLKRFEHGPLKVHRGRPSDERYRDTTRNDEYFNYGLPGSERSDEGAKGWRDSEGDRLEDFGVDEDTDLYDRDDVPLADLLRRRRGNYAVPHELPI